MKRIRMLWLVVTGILLSTNIVLAESPACQERNWNSGTQQTMSVNLPAGSTTKEIIISVKNLDANEFDGKCPSSVPYPPTVQNYEQRKCKPQVDMTVERVLDRDEGDKHVVTIEIKNGNEAPPRTVKLCVKYDK